MARETLFLSDLHLTGNRPETVRRFLRFIEKGLGNAEALYILGDLFDAYIGDDDDSYPQRQVKAALRKAVDQGVAVHFQHGNRDFLLGREFADATGAQLLPDYAVIDLHGTQTLLTHGDLLCTDDIQYQAARLRVRSEVWKRHALEKPLWLRRLYARWYRFKSGRDKGAKTFEIMDVNPTAVVEVMANHRVTRLIHGHTHRPGVHRFELGGLLAERFVLPEWSGQEWVLAFDRNGYRQIEVVGL